MSPPGQHASYSNALAGAVAGSSGGQPAGAGGMNANANGNAGGATNLAKNEGNVEQGKVGFSLFFFSTIIVVVWDVNLGATALLQEKPAPSAAALTEKMGGLSIADGDASANPSSSSSPAAAENSATNAYGAPPSAAAVVANGMRS